jgi:hypothetical protein
VSDPALDPASDPESPDDSTLGGYFEVHDRPPAFEGADGHPYTVSVEVEKTGDLRAPYHAFLVFPRWALTGVGIVGHVETPVLWTCAGRDAVVREAGLLPLYRVQELLDQAIRRSDLSRESPNGSTPDHSSDPVSDDS